VRSYQAPYVRIHILCTICILMHHGGIGCPVPFFSGICRETTERFPSYPNPMGWRSLSGKVAHKVAHNDASNSERNLKAASDHDQERLPHCHRINRTFWLCAITPRLFASVESCRVLRVWAALQQFIQWLREFCRAKRVYIGSYWPIPGMSQLR